MQQVRFKTQSGELSARERAIADLAIKISTSNAFTNGARAEYLRESNLQEEDIHEVIRVAALFNYWQQQRVPAPPPPAEVFSSANFEEALPYYFEGTYPPTDGSR